MNLSKTILLIIIEFSTKFGMLKIRIVKPVKIKVRSDPYIWNGTFLGSFDQSVILNQTDLNGLKYVHISLWGFKSYGILVSSTQSTNADLLCIYDELKEVFGLVKTGTHTLNIKGKKYVLYRAISTNTLHLDEVI